jgi:hypothetical protein
VANILLTLECNRACRYCFGKGLLEKSAPADRYMSRETFDQVMAFLIRSSIDQVRLAGGEPTLHPDFARFVERSLGGGMRVLVFSNGLIPKDAMECLAAAPSSDLCVLINVSSPEEMNPSEATLQGRSFSRLKQKVVLGHTIHNPGRRLDFLLEIIDRHGLGRTIRLGLANPCVDGSNVHLRPKMYGVAAERIMALHRRAKRMGVNLEFDCGLVPCMFPDDFLTELGPDVETIFRRCGPVPDVLPDGSVVSCYGLAPLVRLKLDNACDAVSLRARFAGVFESYRPLGIFRKCAACTVLETGQCAGGCLAAAMKRLERQPPFLSSGIDHPVLPSAAADTDFRVGFVAFPRDRENIEPPSEKTNRWVIPYVDQPLSFWEKLHDALGRHIMEVYFPLQWGIVGSGRPPQQAPNLDEFLRHSPFPLSVLINPIVLPTPVRDIEPRIMDALSRLHKTIGLAGVTISNLMIGARIREAMPDLRITGSVLLDIYQPNQVALTKDICDAIVPSSRVMRDLPALQALRNAFPGRIRMLVNEACLPACPFRTQHFYEMSTSVSFPESLCDAALRARPWLRLTGAWVLPQHLHMYAGLYDELKLAGRVTLKHPAQYLRTLDGYIHRRPLTPDQIGGGPASVLDPFHISADFFRQTLTCGRQCHKCQVCEDYYKEETGEKHASTRKHVIGSADLLGPHKG